MPIGLASLDCCRNCAATLMTENDEQWHMQVFSSIFQATKFGIGNHVSRHAHDKQVPKALVKDNFRRHPGVSATQDFRVWVLPGSQLPQTRRGLVRMLVVMRDVVSVAIF